MADQSKEIELRFTETGLDAAHQKARQLEQTVDRINDKAGTKSGAPATTGRSNIVDKQIDDSRNEIIQALRESRRKLEAAEASGDRINAARLRRAFTSNADVAQLVGALHPDDPLLIAPQTYQQRRETQRGMSAELAAANRRSRTEVRDRLLEDSRRTGVIRGQERQLRGLVNDNLALSRVPEQDRPFVESQANRLERSLMLEKSAALRESIRLYNEDNKSFSDYLNNEKRTRRDRVQATRRGVSTEAAIFQESIAHMSPGQQYKAIGQRMQAIGGGRPPGGGPPMPPGPDDPHFGEWNSLSRQRAGAWRNSTMGKFLSRPSGMGMYMNVMFGGWEVAQAYMASLAAQNQQALASTREEYNAALIAGAQAGTQGIWGSSLGAALDLFGVGPQSETNRLTTAEALQKAQIQRRSSELTLQIGRNVRQHGSLSSLGQMRRQSERRIGDVQQALNEMSQESAFLYGRLTDMVPQTRWIEERVNSGNPDDPGTRWRKETYYEQAVQGDARVKLEEQYQTLINNRNNLLEQHRDDSYSEAMQREIRQYQSRQAIAASKLRAAGDHFGAALIELETPTGVAGMQKDELAFNEALQGNREFRETTRRQNRRTARDIRRQSTIDHFNSYGLTYEAREVERASEMEALEEKYGQGMSRFGGDVILTSARWAQDQARSRDRRGMQRQIRRNYMQSRGLGAEQQIQELIEQAGMALDPLSRENLLSDANLIGSQRMQQIQNVNRNIAARRQQFDILNERGSNYATRGVRASVAGMVAQTRDEELALRAAGLGPQADEVLRLGRDRLTAYERQYSENFSQANIDPRMNSYVFSDRYTTDPAEIYNELDRAKEELSKPGQTAVEGVEKLMNTYIPQFAEAVAKALERLIS